MKFDSAGKAAMKEFEVHHESNHIVAFNKLLFKTFPLRFFDPVYLESNGLINPSVANQQGRGMVSYFTFDGINMVLRHYYRGGFPAKIANDHYVWCGLEKSRAMKELTMLSTLRAHHLPVPEPVAMHLVKTGWLYQQDIITVQIPNTTTLSERLYSSGLHHRVWKKIGETIKKFHDRNCNHADLNASNIMIDQHDQIHLIDFDRSVIDFSTRAWREHNLKRLRRSLDRYNTLRRGFHYTDANFSSLLSGYHAS